MIRRVCNKIKKIGFIPTIQLIIQKLIGVDGYREELDTLHYFLNTCHDVTCAHPASDPDLRIMQLCDAELLRIVTGEIDKLGLSYWLDYGTLLGAVRHKGFIPWDDDMDIAMPRKDYNIALKSLHAILVEKGLTFEETDHIGIGYKHEQTGIWIDIFAIDEYFTAEIYEEAFNQLEYKIPRYRHAYEKNVKVATTEWKAQNRRKIIGGKDEGLCLLYHQPEFKYLKDLIHSADIVFPLSEVIFEGKKFSAPGKVDKYLSGIYGNNYMSFPRTGVLHHGLNRAPLSTWAKRNNVDMHEVLKILSEI